MVRTRMMATRWMLMLSCVLGLVLSTQIPALVLPAAAEEIASPEVGRVVLEDPLTAPGVVGQSSACPTGKNVREFVGEGTIIKVTGRCTDASTNASLAQRIDGLTLPDGEVRLEMKVVSAQERARFFLDFRAAASLRDGSYSVRVDPAGGGVQLRRTVDGQLTVLAERTNLAGIIAPDDWNSLVVRMQGANLWVLLNDQPLLSASDAALSTGSVLIALVRTGDPNDAQEAAVVVRDLRVSALAAGDQARLPSYQPRRAAAPAAPSGAPWIGDITFGYDRSGAGAVPAGGQLADVSAGDIYGFFSWRNVAPGSRIGVKILWGGEVRDVLEFSPSGPDGRTWVGIMSFDSEGGGGARFTFADVGLVFLLDGKEIARGGAALP